MPRVKLTKSRIDALTNCGADVIYSDARCPGFGVNVTPLSSRDVLNEYTKVGDLELGGLQWRSVRLDNPTNERSAAIPP
jgi:hypothetical protein